MSPHTHHAPLLDRAAIEQALRALGERLIRRGVTGELYVFGSAAMALAYDTRRVTRDVDATFHPHGAVQQEAAQVAAELHLPQWWLNELASFYVATQPDQASPCVFDHPGLRVHAASPRHLLAMKILASRQRDGDDIATLARHLGLTTPEAALRVCEEVFPEEPLPDRAKAVVEQALMPPPESA